MMHQKPVPPETAAQDERDAQAIRGAAGALTALIRAAAKRGLNVNLGLSSGSMPGAHWTEVSDEIHVERPIKWEAD